MSFQYRRINTWICQICGTQLSQDVYPCYICSKMEEEIEEKNQSYLICKKCTYANSKNAMRCQVCDVQLLQQNPKIQQKHLHLTCPKCHKQNNIQNTQCVYCDQQLFESQKKICPICESKVKQHSFDNHYSSCLTSRALLQKEQLQRTQQLKKQEELSLKILKNQQNKSKEECIYCRVKLFPHQINQHTKKCRETAMLAFKFDPSTRMTELQTQAIRYMHLKSQKQHNQSKPALQQRVKKLGYTIQDLNNLQFYVQNYAPIIIHIHVSKHMEFFVKDTHYRSQFQTNKSSGSLSRQSRTSWEDRMFDKKYSKAKDFQRVKYGVINFTNDPKGVGACVSYGQSYFLLKPHVRQRCTFTDKDSSNADASIATFKYCFKILSKMNDNQLKAAFNASKAQQISSKCVATYKQMQIHGPIQFGKDIERIYVNKNEVKANKNLLEMVYDFSKKFNVEHDFI